MINIGDIFYFFPCLIPLSLQNKSFILKNNNNNNKNRNNFIEFHKIFVWLIFCF